ncbi:LysR family transcriptional regulator [Dongia sp.]|jgi:DNA-binding transcriptional LysR family regulator|uniref:LysR family transcriptional regulator n=1 Tax=Dongia sp. TaxID=1977262 RepID=UPI0035B1B1C6
MLDWDDLRYFMALADGGGLAAASRKLKVEHATVARRIAALEEKLGAQLVDRRPRRYELTEAGRRVVAHARAMETEAFAIERDLLGGADSRVVDLAVSAPPLLARLAARHLGRLRASHPDIRLTLLGETRNVSLLRREADLALRLARPTDQSLVIRKVGALCYRLYGSAAYLAATRAPDYAFIAFDESLDDLPQQVWLKEQMAGFQNGDRQVALRSNDLGTQAEAAAAGIGLAVLPHFIAAALGLKAAGPRQLSFQRDIWLTYHRDLQKNPSVKAAATFLAGCMPMEKGPA